LISIPLHLPLFRTLLLVLCGKLQRDTIDAMSLINLVSICFTIAFPSEHMTLQEMRQRNPPNAADRVGCYQMAATLGANNLRPFHSERRIIIPLNCAGDTESLARPETEEGESEGDVRLCESRPSTARIEFGRRFVEGRSTRSTIKHAHLVKVVIHPRSRHFRPLLTENSELHIVNPQIK
jgi:hypothetical protein